MRRRPYYSGCIDPIFFRFGVSMAETYQVVTKVWIAPGCIVCDACENDCPEVFDVQEETCLIRPPAMNAEFLQAADSLHQNRRRRVPGRRHQIRRSRGRRQSTLGGSPVGEPASAGGAITRLPWPLKRPRRCWDSPDPKMQALLSTSKISPSLSAGLASSIRRSPEINQAEEAFRAVKLPKDAPPDQRLAHARRRGGVSAGGADGAAPPRYRRQSRQRRQTTRRQFNFALAIGWAALAFVGATFGAMFQDFFGPKVLKEPKKQIRVGRMADFANSGVYEQYKPDRHLAREPSARRRKADGPLDNLHPPGLHPQLAVGGSKIQVPLSRLGLLHHRREFRRPDPAASGTILDLQRRRRLSSSST